MKITSGPAIEKVGDLASILTNLASGDILFIDEIHRLNKMVEEILYPAMESGVLDIIIGKGPSARTIQLDLPPFTLIAATTRVALVSSPLRSRFSGGVFRLEFYSNEEIAKIVARSSKLLNIKFEEEALEEIAKRSRFTPRTANYFLKRVRDYAQVYKKNQENNGSENLSKKTVNEALAMLAIDEIGLNSSDRRFLEILIEKFNGGPVGLKTIGAAMSEEEATVEEVIEPYLIQLGLLQRSARGRIATNKAYEHLGFEIPID
ncbi:MAG: Holliday junction ATP-dependent DNA helicase RuvB [Candidatus Nomurabacteria bacterium GW2011_GWA2_40_9]|uniref:Holliday junction branch migration complex subunit RuvB n=1 Tax=Candidatus Nomurabacteria bacterium GW2011_GWA2_40_9 TaxID=1618734 RepID=A0A0G0W680_9BACT|nr:MAG: Holliday junction ATP-dependent DNA helicase RuvB [Candidatus Nomurabacteria bacterium GW2011_GWA2_40_9]